MIKATAHIILIICAVAFSEKATAQIVISNKDLEGTPCRAVAGGTIDSVDYDKVCPIADWYLCEYFTACIDENILVGFDGSPLYPISGSTYLLMSSTPNILWGSMSTHLSCKLQKNKRYIMDYWAANWFEFGKGVASKTLIVWGNTDSCSRIEKLWESEQIDTGWHRYTAILTPQQKDYEYIHFRIGLSDSNSRYLSLDALSDIYPFNANDVTATIKDTTFTKPNTTCIELNATANITTYDTVYWQDAVGNKIADGFNGGTVCPDASTYYIIAMRDSVPDCAGIWWSYDTVKVTVNTGTAVLSPEVYPDFFGRGGWGRIFPNPATNTLTLQLSAQPSTLNSQFTFSIQNTIGQTLLTAPIYDQQMTIDVSSLPNGVYIFTLYQSNKILKYEKLIK